MKPTDYHPVAAAFASEIWFFKISEMEATICRTNKYYPDCEKIYPDVKLTPAVLAVLRQSDRQMRRFEEELKAEHFEFDNEKRIARFMPSREDSYERLLEEGHLQFGSEDIDVESLVLRRESIRCLQRAM